MIHYNKLVRDRIPQIIMDQGKTPAVRILDDGDYLSSLDQKLGEEMKEYLEDGNVEELADILEVIYAIAKLRGHGQPELEQMRLKKRESRGGFEQKIFLVSVTEATEEEATGIRRAGI